MSVTSISAWHSLPSFPSEAPFLRLTCPHFCSQPLNSLRVSKLGTATNSCSFGLAHSTPPSLGPAVAFPHCPLLDATRVLLSKGRPSRRVPARKPLPHPASTVPMRYSSNRQKVLRFCGAMVCPCPTLSASCAADQPFRPREAASHPGLLPSPGDS